MTSKIVTRGGHRFLPFAHFLPLPFFFAVCNSAWIASASPAAFSANLRALHLERPPATAFIVAAVAAFAARTTDFLFITMLFLFLIFFATFLSLFFPFASQTLILATCSLNSRVLANICPILPVNWPPATFPETLASRTALAASTAALVAIPFPHPFFLPRTFFIESLSASFKASTTLRCMALWSHALIFNFLAFPFPFPAAIYFFENFRVAFTAVFANWWATLAAALASAKSLILFNAARSATVGPAFGFAPGFGVGDLTPGFGVGD